MNSKSFIKSKKIRLELQVVGFDAVGSEVVAGPLEELPKRIVIAGIRELKKVRVGIRASRLRVGGTRRQFRRGIRERNFRHGGL